MRYIFLACILTFTSQAFGGIFGRCNNCYVPQHHVVQNNVIVVEEKKIISPVRVTRYREIPGLRLVEDEHGKTLALLGNRVLNLNEGKTTSIVEEIKGSVVTERIITRRDVYGNQTVTVEQEISK